MSKIIKASHISGEYKLNELSYYKKKIERKEKSPLFVGDKSVVKEEEELDNKRIKKAEKRAAEIIKKAEADSEEIRKKAEVLQEEAEKAGFNKGYQVGYQKGLEEGTDEGYKQGLEELKQIINKFEDILQETEKELDASIDNLYKDIINLTIKITRKILNTELRLNPKIINSIIKGLLKELLDIEKIVIYVSPDLSQYIAKDEIKKEYSKNNIKFLTDAELEAGDCIVETMFGCKDGTIEKQLSRMEQELLKGAGFYEEN